MFRIRRIYDTTLPLDRKAVDRVREILMERFPLIDQGDIDSLPEDLQNPLSTGYRTILFVAENERRTIRGFGLLCHFPDLKFCYLDFLSVPEKHGGGGIGSALFERIRQEARALGDSALFMECLPDDPALCRDETLLKENKARLRFYERYGARPLAGTGYETPLSPGDDCPPYLVVDPLDRPLKLSARRVRKIVRAILTRKYEAKCPPEYVDMVAGSITDDPVRLREPRYSCPVTREQAGPAVSADLRIGLAVNDRHHIHHIHERGYVEAPVRIASIKKELDRTGLFEGISVKQHPERFITDVHDRDFVRYLKTICSRLPENKSLYPYVFPIRNASRPPRELPVRAGYYCIDTFTPLNANAYKAARRAVDCGLSAADEILAGRRLAYALVRPPGHHAEQRAFGGFCYFNTAAVAAHHLSSQGKVAVLDVDYHHGNGTQNIFYHRKDVLTVSIHGHPRFAYPYFSGFVEETGDGDGAGYNRNFPLLERIDGEKYSRVLERALKVIKDFGPVILILALGLDAAKGDPTGTWGLTARDFHHNGRMIGSLNLPTLVIQEGGYRIRSLGVNARNFFQGLFQGATSAGRL